MSNDVKGVLGGDAGPAHAADPHRLARAPHPRFAPTWRAPSPGWGPLKVVMLGGRTQQRYWPKLGYGDSWEVWGMNSLRPEWAAPFARMFNLHRLAHLERDCPQYVDWDTAWSQRNPEVPIYVCDSWGTRLKNEVIFPLERLKALPRGGDYHAGSFDMMVALAIAEGAIAIRIHGVGLQTDPGEPISARACLEYWIGVAEGRGIQVTVSDDCELFRQFHIVQKDTIYGFDDVKIIEKLERS